MFEIKTEVSFSAAHCLKNYDGPCENVHGHNWLVRAVVVCESLDAIGLGIDFKKLRAYLKETLAQLDHKDLNTIFDKLNQNPSSENIARFIYTHLKAAIAPEAGMLRSIEVFETPGNSTTYYE
ncbi:MAG: 6-carboxytetrahydropterin synthase QueD [Chitinivibrionales bacterium]|nr:6-carboxytetrahydropterin synthase QueD [Chitinivibrionales bacterium]